MPSELRAGPIGENQTFFWHGRCYIHTCEQPSTTRVGGALRIRRCRSSRLPREILSSAFAVSFRCGWSSPRTRDGDILDEIVSGRGSSNTEEYNIKFLRAATVIPQNAGEDRGIHEYYLG